jgi:regulator of sirC expression with transglutaminase-like and TPR domain
LTDLSDLKEIMALFQLIDDPDAEVYDTVSTKIMSFGKAIIPDLEAFWEKTPDMEVQERIENLIHRLHFKDLTEGMKAWKSESSDLLKGALLVARYHYPALKEQPLLQEIEKMRRNIWLELSPYITPLEQVNVIAAILYNYCKLQGIELAYDHPEDFLINKTIESKKGNAFGNGLLYLILSTQLDLPIQAVSIPRQFILGYFDTQYEALNPKGHPAEKILFFIDPVSGQMYSHKDIETYFRKVSVPPVPSYYRPLNNRKVIRLLLEELSKCFDNESNRYKMNDLLFLAEMIDS